MIKAAGILPVCGARQKALTCFDCAPLTGWIPSAADWAWKLGSLPFRSYYGTGVGVGVGVGGAAGVFAATAALNWPALPVMLSIAS